MYYPPIIPIERKKIKKENNEIELLQSTMEMQGTQETVRVKLPAN